MLTLNSLYLLGFDRSEPFGKRWAAANGQVGFVVRCSQCESAVINGTPTHETGCPNATHECNGCNVLIPARQRYCEDCQS